MLCADANLDIVGLGTYISVGDVAATEEAMRFAQAAGATLITRGNVSAPDVQFLLHPNCKNPPQ